MLNKRKIKICLGSSCFSRGNNELVSIVEKYIRNKHIEDKVEFSGDHCCNECIQGPNFRVGGKVFHQVTKESILQILDKELGELL
jgi:NADH:ubiquinone oxidoreductase subunit E